MTEGDRLVRTIGRRLRELDDVRVTLRQATVTAVSDGRVDVDTGTGQLAGIRLFGGSAAVGEQVWLLGRQGIVIAVGTVGPATWHPLTLINGWAAYDGSPVEWTRDPSGRVSLRGTLDSTGATVSTVAVLPAVARPVQVPTSTGVIMLPALTAAGAIARVAVESGGGLRITNWSSVSVISLDGLSFYAGA